jgi:hypothetical protein
VEEWQLQAVSTRLYRSKIIPYSVSRRILEDEEFRLTITLKEYYNQLRNARVNHTNNRTVEAIPCVTDRGVLGISARLGVF